MIHYCTALEILAENFVLEVRQRLRMGEKFECHSVKRMRRHDEKHIKRSVGKRNKREREETREMWRSTRHQGICSTRASTIITTPILCAQTARTYMKNIV